MNTKHLSIQFATSVLVSGAMLLSPGCQSGQDMGRSGQVHVEAIDHKSLDVSKPSVRQDGADLVISGTIRKQPQSSGPGIGHLHVELVNASGAVLQRTTIDWTPPSLPPQRPGRGGRVAYYTARVPWALPQNATIRVSVAGDSHTNTASIRE